VVKKKRLTNCSVLINKLFALQFGCATVFASEIFPQFNMLQKEPQR